MLLITSCAGASTICPRPSPPSVGAAEPTAPADRNVAVGFTLNTFPRSPLQLPHALTTLKVVAQSRVTWATSVLIVFLGLSVLDLGPMYATDRQTDRQTSDNIIA